MSRGEKKRTRKCMHLPIPTWRPRGSSSEKMRELMGQNGREGEFISHDGLSGNHKPAKRFHARRFKNQKILYSLYCRYDHNEH